MADTSTLKGVTVYGATGDESSPVELGEVVEEFGIRRIHLKLLIVQWLIAACPSTVVSGPPYVLSYVRKEYGVHSWEAAFLTSGVLCGAMLGVIIFGPLADKIGRRLCIMMQLVILTVCSVGHLFLPLGKGLTEFAVLVLLRFVIGTAFGPLASFAPVLFSEFLSMTNRGFMLVITSLGWTLGSLTIIAMSSIFEGSWRIVLACPACFSLLALPLVYLSPESPRYLYVSNRAEEGRQVVNQVLSSPMLFSSADVHCRFSEAPQNVVVSMANVLGSSKADEISTAERVQKLFTQEHRRSTILNIILWMCIAGASYATMVWTPIILKELLALKRVPYEIFAYGEVSSLLGCILAAFWVDTLGRKNGMTCGFAVAAVCTTLWVLLPHYWAILVSFNLSQVGIALTWSAVGTWCTEKFPTDVRGTAIGLGSLSGRVTGSCLPTLVGMVMDGYEAFGKLQGMNNALYIIAAVYALGSLASLCIQTDTMLEKMPDI